MLACNRLKSLTIVKIFTTDQLKLQEHDAVESFTDFTITVVSILKDITIYTTLVVKSVKHSLASCS